jgi:tubulin beta
MFFFPKTCFVHSVTVKVIFFNIAYALLAAKGVAKKMTLTVTECTKQVFGKKNMLCNIDPSNGKSLAVSCVYRGAAKSISTQDVDENIQKIQNNNSDDFVEWIPNNMKSSIVNILPTESDMDCTSVTNTTALKGVFQRLATQFGTMFRRKAFLHWYTGEGMDEMEFQEADKNVRDLITEYQDKQDAVFEEDEGSEEEEES